MIGWLIAGGTVLIGSLFIGRKRAPEVVVEPAGVPENFPPTVREALHVDVPGGYMVSGVNNVSVGPREYTLYGLVSTMGMPEYRLTVLVGDPSTWALWAVATNPDRLVGTLQLDSGGAGSAQMRRDFG